MNKSGQDSLSLGWRSLPGGIAALAVLGLLRLGVWQPLEQLSYNALFQLRGPQVWHERVAIIVLDEASVEQLDSFPRSPQQYTELLQALTPPNARPAVIVLDELFLERGSGDDALAQAIQAHGSVVLSQAWDRTGNPDLLQPKLRDVAAAIGHGIPSPDSDGITRRIEPQVQNISALGIAAVQIDSEQQNFAQLPDLSRPLRINWPSPVQQAPVYSFVDVLQGEVPATLFQDKIVVVGATATVIGSLQTPFDYSPPTHSLFLHAAVIENLLASNWLRTPLEGWWPLLLLVAGPGLSVVLINRSAALQVILVLSLCGGWGGLSLLLLQANYQIPVATPIALIAATGGTLALYRQFKTNILLQEQLKMNALLQQSEERYELAVRGANEGLWDWDLQTNQIYFSPRWKTLLGYEDAEISQQPEEWLGRVHIDDQDALKAAIFKHLKGETAYFEHEHRIQHHDGTYRWMLSRGIAVRDPEGNAYRMAGSQAEITERKQAEQQLRHHAFYDSLTDLPNRALFLSRLRQVMHRTYPDRNNPGRSNPDQTNSEHVTQERATSEPHLFAVCALDLDRFKVINNSLGHAAGDQLLVAIARRLASCLHHHDVVAHFGGGEFVILLRKIRDANDAMQLAERIHKALSLPFHLDGGTTDAGEEPDSREFHEVFTTVSLGIALSNQEYDHPEGLLRDADIAMHNAKALGTGRSAVFNPTMRGYSKALLQMETDLRRAIKRQELEVFYQPIVSLARNNQITGFEALVRWHHQEQGMVSPVQFIPVAEETGLITALGWWVLREACRQLQSWQRQFPNLLPLTMSVNLSGIQFAQPGLIQQIQWILQETELSGQSLKLEITESVIMMNAESVNALLQQLRSLDIQLCIDDFGTGYSSLGRLHHLPINTLKIDRSFISPQDYEGESWEIVRTIINLAHNLGLDVVAEGIETEEQLAQLRSLQCEYGQGYYFSRPVNSQSMAALLAEQAQALKLAEVSDATSLQ